MSNIQFQQSGLKEILNQKSVLIGSATDLELGIDYKDPVTGESKPFGGADLGPVTAMQFSPGVSNMQIIMAEKGGYGGTTLQGRSDPVFGFTTRTLNNEIISRHVPDALTTPDPSGNPQLSWEGNRKQPGEVIVSIPILLAPENDQQGYFLWIPKAILASTGVISFGYGREFGMRMIFEVVGDDQIKFYIAKRDVIKNVVTPGA